MSSVKLRVRQFCLLLALLAAALQAASPGIVFEGTQGPGKGKHIVLIAGDQEYRSEEALPQLARILATRHGFKCTVLFCIDRKTARIDLDKPNIPGLEVLARPTWSSSSFAGWTCPTTR